MKVSQIGKLLREGKRKLMKSSGKKGKRHPLLVAFFGLVLISGLILMNIGPEKGAELLENIGTLFLIIGGTYIFAIRGKKT